MISLHSRLVGDCHDDSHIGGQGGELSVKLVRLMCSNSRTAGHCSKHIISTLYKKPSCC